MASFFCAGEELRLVAEGVGEGQAGRELGRELEGIIEVPRYREFYRQA